MTDQQRPELEWPSEDLAQARARKAQRDDVAWPTTDRAGGEPEATRAEPVVEPPAWTPEPQATALPPAPEPQAAPAWTPEPQAAPPWTPEPQGPPPQPVLPSPEPPTDPWLPPSTTQPPVAEPPPTYPGTGYGAPTYPPPAYPPPAYPPAAPPAPGPFGVSPAPASSAPPPPPAVPTGPYAVATAPTRAAPASAGVPAEREYFRPDIEGLRAVAVLAVLLFHIGLPFAAGGYVGVDVFYVISGFLITGLLLREGEANGSIDLLRFYARRMRRLLPAALLVIVVTLALSAVVVSPLRLTEIAGDAAASALYVANFRFAIEATDYLALEAPSPLLHYWSLGVEEQFYLVWPVILLVAVRFLPGRLIGLFFLVLAVASFGLSLYWTETAPAWAFFSPLTRAWELAAGALIAIGLLRIPSRVQRIASPIAVVGGLALIVVAVVVLGVETPFPGLAALLPVVGASLIIVAGVGGTSLPARLLLSNPISRYIGRISYSLYLWHWPLIILVPLALENDDITIRIGMAVAAMVLAALTTELVEQPFRRSGALARRSRVSVQVGLAASAAVGVVALVMTGTIRLPANLVPPDPVVVQLAGVREDLPRSYFDGCHLTIDAAKPRDDCVYGDPEGVQTAFLVGDSHAAQWIPALDAYAADKGWRLQVHTKAACSVVDVPLWERALRRTYDECFKWREAVQRRIAREGPEVVFVGSSRDYELWDNGRILKSNQVYTYWQGQLASLLATLDEAAGRVVLLAETPFLNFDPVDCLADGADKSCDPSAALAIDRQYAALESAAADAAGASVLSANQLLCPGSSCPVVADGIVVFRDRHHVTATYMERLAEPISNLLEGRPPYPLPTASPGAALARN